MPLEIIILSDIRGDKKKFSYLRLKGCCIMKADLVFNNTLKFCF